MTLSSVLDYVMLHQHNCRQSVTILGTDWESPYLLVGVINGEIS